MDKGNKEKFLADLLKLQTMLMRTSDLVAMSKLIEGFLRGCSLFDTIEIKTIEIGKEKIEPLKENELNFSIESGDKKSLFKVRPIDSAMLKEYLPFLKNLFQFCDLIIEKRKELNYNLVPDSFLRLFKESMLPILVYSIEDGLITDANTQACLLYGYTLDEFKKKKINEIIATNPSEFSKSYESVSYPSNGLTKSVSSLGKIMDVIIRTSEIEVDGKKYGFMIIQDITDYLKLQNERQRIQHYIDRTKRLESLRFLLRGVAHDFNNYLSSIIGFSELSVLELGNTSPEVVNNLKEIEKAGHKCRELVKSILRFGKTDDEMQIMINPVELIKDVKFMLESGIAKTIKIDFVHENITDMIYFNPIALQEVIVNIIMNSVQAFPENKGDIKIKLELLDNLSKEFRNNHPNLKADRYFYILIEDNGIGISRENIEKVFEPFFTTKEKALGLGLTTAYNIIKSANGDIEIESTEGAGTKVKIFLPVIPAHIETQDQEKPLQIDTQISANILILDDESQITMYMKKILESKGFLVHTENNPTNALNLFHIHINFFDLVICNLNMPSMSGVEFIRKVREIQKSVPIIMVSGDQPNKEITEDRELNISAYLTKPVTIATLEAAINKTLISNK